MKKSTHLFGMSLLLFATACSNVNANQTKEQETAFDTINLVKGIGKLMLEYKNILRPLFGKYYKHELLNNLFFHPYTKLEYFQRDMSISRQTASKYLDKIVSIGLLEKIKLGRENYYVNKGLMALFLIGSLENIEETDTIESINE
ncbi:MAG: hypothetical protein E7081_08080 [Bacteroidales bacterium]|nr:hypothetical protein [Bacteroidales bacterium]